MMTGAVLILRGIAVAACREKTGEKSAGYETGNWQSLDLRQFLCRGGTDSVKRAAGGTLGSVRLGYPAEVPQARPRRSLEQSSDWRGFEA